MKKLLYCAAALAVAFFAGSCQQEKLEPVQESNAVTFTVEAPAALQTRAIADGLNVNELVYEVWLTETLGDLTQNAQKLYQAKTDMAVENGVNKATITLDLVNDQKFTVLFWAQVKEEGAYNTDELTAVTYAKSEYNANNESLAAFYAVAYVNDCQHVKKDGSATGSQVTLYRPFAQLNLGTLNTSTAYTVALVSSEVNVKNVNTVFNVATSVASVPKEMTFKMAAVPTDPATLAVNGASYEYAGMNYMFAGDNVTVEYDIVTSLNGGMEGTVNNIVDAVPLKENYRTNIVGNLLTSKVDYEIVVDADFNEPDEMVAVGSTVVRTSEELAAALKEDKEHINIFLDEVGNVVTRAGEKKEFEIAISAWTEKYYFGGASTKTITINANGNKINFVHENGDWNYIRCVNDAAKWIINDATLTNSGKNNGPWNRHDIRFYNAVELNNVTSDKAIALLNDGKLNDVQISDVHPENSEAYGLWITAEGQTVSLDGVTITPSEGKTTDRAIKIADQYVDSPAKVTLNVSNSKFVSQKKAAVLVTSKAGAVINWGRGNDITGVAADPANAVWVDGGTDYQNIEDVTVTGASVIIEGQVSSTPVVTNAEQLKAAIAAAGKDKQTVILLKAGTYTGTFNIDGKNVALIGEDDVVIDGLVFGLGASHILLRNITLTNEHPAGSGITNRTNADYFCLGAYAAAFVIEDCVFNVSNQGNAAGKGAINIGDGFNAYSASDEYELIVRNTVFNCNGERPIRAKTSSWIEGCTFVDQYRYAIQVQGNNQAATEKVIFNNNTIIDPCTTSGEPFAAGVSISKAQKLSDAAFTISGNTLESAAFEDLKFVYDISDNVQITTCTLNGKQIEDTQLFVIEGVDDAKEVYMELPYSYDGENTYTVYTPLGLSIINAKMADRSLGRDAIVVLANDIDFTGYTWTPVDSHADIAFEIAEINGNGHTISNFTVNGQAMFKRFAGSGDVVIKDITFDNATVNSTAINTSILTVQTYQNVLLDNVDVKNSTITGGYKVAPLLATVYNESSSTVTATLKNCDVENVTVKATSYDFCTAGMVAFVYADDNDKVVFENCKVKDVKLFAPDDSYKAHAAVYTTGSSSLYDEAEGVTVTNVTFEAL